MVGAWADGLLPKELLASVQPEDRHWWLRLHLFLAEYASRRRQQYVEAELRYLLAGAVGARSVELSGECWRLAGDSLKELREHLTPWQRDAAQAAPDADQLTRLWESEFGSLTDAATQAAIARTAAAMQAVADQGRSARP